MQHTEDDNALWRQLFENEMAFIGARRDFLFNCNDRVEVIRRVLNDAGPLERSTALRLLNYLTIEERQTLFDSLLYLASFTHADITAVHDALLGLPRDWVLANIEKTAEPLLNKGTEEEYYSLLALYAELDRDLTYRLAQRALQHDDKNIREAGEDSMKWLNNK